MPSKETKETTSKKTEYDPDVPTIKAEDFDLSKYQLSAIFEPKDAKGDSAQWFAFPKYEFPAKKGKGNKVEQANMGRCIIVTKPIKMSKGGIPKTDEKWRPTDNDCMYFWLPYDKDDEGSKELFEKVLIPLDEYHLQKLETEGNKEFLYKDDKGKKSSIKKIKYVSSVRDAVVADDDDKADDDEDNEKSEKAEKKENYKRIKVRLDTVFENTKDNKEKKGNPAADRKIKTRFFLMDEDGNPNEEPEPITTLAEARKLLTYNSVVRFALDINKVWVKKTGDQKLNGAKECSYTVKCLQVMIVERSTNQTGSQLVRNVFGNFGQSKKVAAEKSDSEEDDKKSEDNKSEDDKSGDEDTKKGSKDTKKDVKETKETKETKKETKVVTKKDTKKATPKSESESNSEESDSESGSGSGSGSGEESDDSSTKKNNKKKAEPKVEPKKVKAAGRNK